MKHLIFLLIAFVLVTGCKTRKAATVNTETSKKTDTQTETRVSEEIEEKTTDNTKETKQTVTEAKNASKSSIELEADSIVEKTDPKTGKKKRTYYPTPGKKININIDEENSSVVNEVIERQNDMAKIININRDSLEKQRVKTSQDSSTKSKNTVSEGSGKTWAVWGSIAGFLAFAVGAYLLYRKFK